MFLSPPTTDDIKPDAVFNVPPTTAEQLPDARLLQPLDTTEFVPVATFVPNFSGIILVLFEPVLYTCVSSPTLNSIHSVWVPVVDKTYPFVPNSLFLSLNPPDIKRLFTAVVQTNEEVKLDPTIKEWSCCTIEPEPPKIALQPADAVLSIPPTTDEFALLI